MSKAHGQLRQSQVITTFGPGAMLDLPRYSVIIGGLDFWSPKGEKVDEPRLVDKLMKLLDRKTLALHEPPPDLDDPNQPFSSIVCWQFPEWFIVQDNEAKPTSQTRSRRLVHRKTLYKGKYVNEDRVKCSVVPVRFVRACRNGHIGDIDWRNFVHHGSPRKDCLRDLWLDELGTNGDLSELRIRCECGAQRNLGEMKQMQALGVCDGRRPWLGVGTSEACSEPNRLLIRTASNAYFPQLMSVISLPDHDEEIKDAVTLAWDFLETVENHEDLRQELKKSKVKSLLKGMDENSILEEILSRQEGVSSPEKTIKQVELELLLSSQEEIGNDRPDGVFYARRFPKKKGWENLAFMKPIEKIILVHRLREVTAQVGFTRFEASSPDTNGELEMGVRRAELGDEVDWLPAIENRGEGVFLHFNRQQIDAWANRKAVKNRASFLEKGFHCWKNEHRDSKRVFPPMPYILLHSLAHVLMTTITLECGYPSSSLRERIYAIPDVGYGVLLYTGSSDSEGTLGGIVEVGRKIDRYLFSALEKAKLCSHDPVCAQHEPENVNERRFLHGAACHACLLVSETSCEMGNDFLDRALLIPTVETQGMEFFMG